MPELFLLKLEEHDDQLLKAEILLLELLLEVVQNAPRSLGQCLLVHEVRIIYSRFGNVAVWCIIIKFKAPSISMADMEFKVELEKEGDFKSYSPSSNNNVPQH